MHSDSVMTAIDQIAATASKNDKVARIKHDIEHPNFITVLRAALDPCISYGMAKVPRRAGDSPDGFTFDGVHAWTLLNRLASRELSGYAARDAVQATMNALSAPSAELLKRIITKDLRAGFGASTVNKAHKGTILTPPYMRCSLLKEVKIEKFDWEGGAFSQLKADGMFGNISLDSTGWVEITSREMERFPLESMDEIVEAARRYLEPDTQTHGEFVVQDALGHDYPRELSNGKMNRLRSSGELQAGDRVRFHAWDQIPLRKAVPKGRCDTPYVIRFESLKEQLGASPVSSPLAIIETRIVHSLADAYAHYGEVLSRGKEGVVVKDRHTIWEDKTSKWQVKLKLEVDVDLEVCEFLPGEGKNAATFGSILVNTSDHLLEVAVSGFTDAMRNEMSGRRGDLIGSIMTVKGNSVLKPSESSSVHSLFLPRFVEMRNDKTKADTLAQVLAQFDAAVTSAQAASK